MVSSLQPRGCSIIQLSNYNCKTKFMNIKQINNTGKFPTFCTRIPFAILQTNIFVPIFNSSALIKLRLTFRENHKVKLAFLNIDIEDAYKWLTENNTYSNLLICSWQVWLLCQHRYVWKSYFILFYVNPNHKTYSTFRNISTKRSLPVSTQLTFLKSRLFFTLLS